MKRILVVDDNKALNFIMTSIFRRDNYKVDSAFTGSEGIEFLENNDYDVLVTDMNLPDIIGLELILKIKDKPIVKILVAAYLEKQMIDRVRNLDAVFIEKPFNNQELLSAVGSRLE
jgi:DNA-binding response OmpR family regulator